LARLCAGWRPQAVLMRPDVRAKACRLGALATARVLRRKRAKHAVEHLKPLLTSRVCDDLTADQRAAVTTLLAKALRIGKAIGYQQGYHAKDTPRLKRAKKGQAA
jgi:hypothetical protein